MLIKSAENAILAGSGIWRKCSEKMSAKTLLARVWGKLEGALIADGETLLSRWWRSFYLYFVAGRGSYYKRADLAAAEVDRRFSELELKKNVSEKWMALALKADGVDPALSTALILMIWPRLSWLNLQQYFCYYYCQADERWSEQFGISEQFYYYCQNWIWPRFDLWGPSCRNVNRAGMEMKWSWNGVWCWCVD